MRVTKTFSVDSDLHKQIKELAKSKKIKISKIIDELFGYYIEKNKTESQCILSNNIPEVPLGV